MKKCIRWLFLTSFLYQTTLAQVGTAKNYRNFPVILTIQFHSLSFPFHDLKTNFKNVGFGIGTEIALGSANAWAQQFQLSWYRNQQAGNGILFYTQSAWRPTIVSNIYTEIKAGFGLTYNFRPVESFQPANGQWNSVGREGKWLFTVPIGVSLGYNKFSEQTYVAPFASYQLLLNANYDKGVPVLTNSLFQIGTRIHPSAKK